MDSIDWWLGAVRSLVVSGVVSVVVCMLVCVRVCMYVGWWLSRYCNCMVLLCFVASSRSQNQQWSRVPRSEERIHGLRQSSARHDLVAPHSRDEDDGGEDDDVEEEETRHGTAVVAAAVDPWKNAAAAAAVPDDVHEDDDIVVVHVHDVHDDVAALGGGGGEHEHEDCVMYCNETRADALLRGVLLLQQQQHVDDAPDDEDCERNVPRRTAREARVDVLVALALVEWGAR